MAAQSIGWQKGTLRGRQGDP
eukprot:SAG31_NODE_41640_length_275_cov_0.590909_1_plen_20_part_01